jgi:site-specific DNA-methyltransferase (adenine-specific)
MTYQILHGNNLDILPTLADNSIDSIVTDPPYELGFMGKKWDSSGIAYSVELWQQCLRVLKPGGHLLSFGGTRTYHRVAVAIEDAGFELRDSIAWLYGSGFPKSLDVSKAIDKQSGYEGEVIGTEVIDIGMQGGSMHAGRETKLAERQIKTLSTEAQQWQGWGTALKPAFEPVIVARKSIEGTVANNVLKWSTGGLNIDGSRIATDELKPYSPGVHRDSPSSFNDDSWQGKEEIKPAPSGRWPANIILDPYTAELLDEQSGTLKSGKLKPDAYQKERDNSSIFAGAGVFDHKGYEADSGGASRFFYVAKASKRDRNEGLEELPQVASAAMSGNLVDSSRLGGDGSAIKTPTRQNFHPTVKPTSLMEYLIKLVTPPKGTVLDPFTGSGSTGKAAILQGFDFIGIEMTKEYLPIIEGRLKHAEAIVAERIKETSDKQSEVLF